MIFRPWTDPEEIDRRLSALDDPELVELLRAANRRLTESGADYTAPNAPYWKTRIALIALAGLAALTSGYFAGVRPHAVPPAPPQHRQHHTARLVRHAKPVAHAAPPAPAHRRAALAPLHTASAAAASEALIRRTRAQLLHEHAIAVQARAEAARAHHQAVLAMQAQAKANQQALEAALARARAQARAEAIAQAQAQALARAQAQAAAERAQEQALQNATDPNIKPGAGAPPDTGRIWSGAPPNLPMPAPGGPAGGPIDPNCTPHRGSFLINAVLDHVRVGGTNAGALLQLIHH